MGEKFACAGVGDTDLGEVGKVEIGGLPGIRIQPEFLEETPKSLDFERLPRDPAPLEQPPEPIVDLVKAGIHPPSVFDPELCKGLLEVAGLRGGEIEQSRIHIEQKDIFHSVLDDRKFP